MPGFPRAASCTLALAAAVVSGCATAPQRSVVEAPPLDTRVMVYPARGQSPEQLDRDRYECHLWAVRESRFDPSAPGVPEAYRVHVEPAPAPGAATVAGALTGAVLGAAVASPHDEGAGAVVGAVAGAVVGAAVEQSRAEAAQRVEEQSGRRAARYDATAAAYRRAISACLEGRGYTTS
jgi:hypothetical protein